MGAARGGELLMARPSSGLTERERRFVTAYLGRAAGNATKAARLAGYSPRTARQQGHKLLTKVDIRHALEQRVEQRERKAIADADERDELLTLCARERLAGWEQRIAAIKELNKVTGRHVVRVEGRMTLEQLLGESRDV